MLRHMRLKVLIALIIISLVLAACGGDDDAPGPTAQTETGLDRTAWLLESLNGVEVNLQEPITLSFTDGRAGGFSGCNTYGGAYTASTAGGFSMPEIEQTVMACDTGMDLEAEYLAALRKTQHYALIDEQRLQLSDSNDETTLVFSIDNREALDGTSWQVIEIDGSEPVADTRPTLNLQAGEVSGSTGCNQYGGSYTADDAGNITFSELFWTERGCIEPEGIMQQEQSFLSALQSAASYELDPANDQLLIHDSQGRTLLTFVNAA